MTGEVVITLPRPPSPLLSMNQAIGMHWAKYAKRMDPWRDEIAWLAKAHRRTVQAMAKPVTVEMVIHVNPRSRYDPSNMLPNLKSAVDGMKNAGCFPDDGPAWVKTLEPIVIKDRTSRAVTLTIRPAETSRARDIES